MQHPDYAASEAREENSMSANVEALVQRFIEEVWNKGNLAVADELVAPRMTNHFSFTPELEGPEDAKRNIAILWTAFPDIQYEIEELLAAERDMVVVRGDPPWLTVNDTEVNP
jgi:predicted ester cyclase